MGRWLIKCFYFTIYRNRWPLPLNNPSHGPKAPQKKKISSLDALVSYLGKYFQIRDDYMNLTPEVCPTSPLTPTPT